MEFSLAGNCSCLLLLPLLVLGVVLLLLENYLNPLLFLPLLTFQLCQSAFLGQSFLLLLSQPALFFLLLALLLLLDLFELLFGEFGCFACWFGGHRR